MNILPVSQVPIALRKQLYLLPIEFNQWFTIDEQKMAGGFYNYREYDYYQVFAIGDTAKQVLDTRKMADIGLKVACYRDDECREYTPNRFNFRFNE